jgi:hypothetical protein
MNVPNAASTARCSQRRADVRLQEDEQGRHHREPDRRRDRAHLADPLDAVREERGQEDDEQELGELGRLEAVEAEVEPALRAPDLGADGDHDQEQRDHQPEDDPLVAAVEVGVDQRGGDQAGRAEADRERLAHDEVALVAEDVVARDARHHPEPVPDQGGDGSEQQPVEAAQVGGDAPVLERARAGERAPADVVGQSVASAAETKWSMPKYLAKIFWVIGAATAPPKPPFSTIPHTTSSGWSDGP